MKICLNNFNNNNFNKEKNTLKKNEGKLSDSKTKSNGNDVFFIFLILQTILNKKRKRIDDSRSSSKGKYNIDSEGEDSDYSSGSYSSGSSSSKSSVSESQSEIPLKKNLKSKINFS